MPGDRLGHFELVEYVGGGGMGRVFRAIDTQLGRTVALKVLPPEQASDPDALQRFQNEAQSAARLDHDNIARAYYVGEDRGLHFIVFEFVEGVNVRVLVERKGPLPLAEAVSYTLQVAEALAHADARAVVHRDIKPSNVLITPEGRVKLIDMGLARLRHADPAVADLTASGVTLGTFDYISPEQARDPRNADIRSDIYSLGCTFFFMLAGQPPFPEGTVLQKLLQHQGDQPPDIQQFRPELPEESSRVLRKMMAKDPRHRYASPADLVADLLMLAEQIGLRPMSPTSRIWLVPQEPPVSFLQRHLPWMAPGGRVGVHRRVAGPVWSSSSRRDEQLPPAATSAEPVAEAAGRAAASGGRNDAARLAEPRRHTGRCRRWTNKIARRGAERRPRRKDDCVDSGRRIGRSCRAGVSAKRADPAISASSGLPSRVRSAARPQSAADRPRPAPPPKSASPAEAAPKRSGLLIVSETARRGRSVFHAGRRLRRRPQRRRDRTAIQRSAGRSADEDIELARDDRAGEGYQPIVVFRPTDVDPVKYPRSMFTLAGGQLTLIGVAAELHVPRGRSGRQLVAAGNVGRRNGAARTMLAHRAEHVGPRDDVSPGRGLLPRPLGAGRRRGRRRRAGGHAAGHHRTDRLHRPGRGRLSPRRRSAAGPSDVGQRAVDHHRAAVGRRRRPGGPETRRDVADRVAARDGGGARRAVPADQQLLQPLPTAGAVRLDQQHPDGVARRAADRAGRRRPAWKTSANDSSGTATGTSIRTWTCSGRCAISIPRRRRMS